MPPTDPAGLFRVRAGVELVLASSSPRRQQFMRDLGLDFKICQAQNEPPASGAAREHTILAARAKALDVRARLGPLPVIIGADTLVSLDGKILGKPANADEALAMLRALNGRGCLVYSSVCVLLPRGEPLSITDEAAVDFLRWPDEILRAYARDGEPLDKAGAFAVQGKGAFMIAKITGSFTTVMGIPGAKLVLALWRNGIIEPAG